MAPKVVTAPSASTPSGMPEVFDVTMVPNRRTASTRSSSARLTSTCSTTASMIQSTPASRGRLLSEAAGLNQAGNGWHEERIWLELAGALQTLGRVVVGQVQQQRRHARVREVRGNLRSHGAGAKTATDRIDLVIRFRIRQLAGERFRCKRWQVQRC